MISIITINYNNASGLNQTIKSVQNQTYKDFEHIIIDGGSTDESKEIIENHSKHFAYWVSEKDNGVYAAMNKGIAVAKGDYVQFLNSGDVFQDDAVLQAVAHHLGDKQDIYYGDLMFVGDQQPKLQTYPERLTLSYFVKRSLGHPASFIKKELFDEVFYYNEDFKIVSDWEFFICAICKYNASYKYIHRVIARFDVHGISSNEAYQELIKQEKDIVLKKHFSFFLKEFETHQEAVKKWKQPPYSQLTTLLKNRFLRPFVLGLIKVLYIIFPSKNRTH